MSSIAENVKSIKQRVAEADAALTRIENAVKALDWLLEAGQPTGDDAVGGIAARQNAAIHDVDFVIGNAGFLEFALDFTGFNGTVHFRDCNADAIVGCRIGSIDGTFIAGRADSSHDA